MRVIAGKAAGRVLKSFVGPGMRPTTDRVRESWFAVLGGRVEGARFLDLYAGTGAVGIEALSRGAARCVLVERSHRGAQVIRENLRVLDGLLADAVVWQANALAAVPALARAGEVFDLVFADPPYEDLEAPERVLEIVAKTENLLAQGALVTIQHARRVGLPDQAGRLVRCSERTYGETKLTGYELRQQ